ncbi:MAG TPA: sigma factor [Polyangiaceae bacterium]|nr:sigma factor [Polyangiaceae bacterium]
MTPPTLEDLARRAVAGDRAAVAAVLRELERPVYALALRMLWHPEDARDATQEILIRVVTRLSQFDFRSLLTTWVYRVAANYLLDVKKSCVEREKLSFDAFSQDLLDGLSDDGPAEGERSLLTEEVKLGCTLALLECLDRAHRLAYVLGEIFDLPAPEAAAALSLEPAAFRKRLQRARDAIESFTRAHCGLVSNDARCACHRRVPVAVSLGRVHPERPLFAETSASFLEARDLIARVARAERVVELYRRAQPRSASGEIARVVIAALEAPALE